MTRPLVLLPMGPAEEELLLGRLREGRPEAFEALYRRFVDQVFRLAVGMLGDRAAAEDAAQESFLRIYRGIRRFRGRSRLGTWIYRITANVCISDLARRKRQATTTVDPVDLEQAGGQGAGDAAVLDLAAILRGLDPVKRVTFYLHHVEGLSAREVAEVLDDSREAVLKRLQRTRQELAERLRQDEHQNTTKRASNR